MKKPFIILLLIIFTIIACKENYSENKLNEIVEYYPNNSKVIFKKTIYKADFDN